MQFILKEKATGKLEIITSIEEAFKMLEAHTHVMGFLTFADDTMIKASLAEWMKEEATV